jgi:hypothetical protein
VCRSGLRSPWWITGSLPLGWRSSFRSVPCADDCRCYPVLPPFAPHAGKPRSELCTRNSKAWIIRSNMHNQIRRTWLRQDIPGHTLSPRSAEQERRHHPYSCSSPRPGESLRTCELIAFEIPALITDMKRVSPPASLSADEPGNRASAYS